MKNKLLNKEKVLGVFPRKGRLCYKFQPSYSWGEKLPIEWLPVDQYQLALRFNTSDRHVFDEPISEDLKTGFHDGPSYHRGVTIPSGSILKKGDFGNPHVCSTHWYILPEDQ